MAKGLRAVGTITDDGNLEIVRMRKMNTKWQSIGETTTIDMKQILATHRQKRNEILTRQLTPRIFWLLCVLHNNNKLRYSDLKSQCPLKHNEFLKQLRFARNTMMVKKEKGEWKDKIYSLTPRGENFVETIVSLIRSTVWDDMV